MLSRTASRPRCSHLVLPNEQVRHATLIRRPKRPYTFTQLITLSDGSTFTHRTTSPQPIYRSTKDTKNNALWNPSSQKLLNVEEDEAGRLRRFRERFGRGFDVEAASSEAEMNAGETESAEQQEESLLDLISGYGQPEKAAKQTTGAQEGKQKTGKGKSSGK